MSDTRTDARMLCYDIMELPTILHEEHGTWFNADLLRAIYKLLPHADTDNAARLRSAFPKQCALITAWMADRRGSWAEYVESHPELDELDQ